MKHFLILLAAFALLVISCGQKAKDYDNISDADKVTGGGIYIDATAGDASKLLPFLTADTTSSSISDLIFSGLTRRNENLELEGDLADSWIIEDGGLKITFKLHEGIKWADGQPFTSADVKYTWQIIMDEKTASPRKASYELVKSIETPDPLTLVVNYSKPYARAIESWGLGIAPRHLLEAEKAGALARGEEFDINKSRYNREPVGLGPYMLKQWVDKQFIELVANPDWWRGKTKIDRYVLKIIPEPSTQLLELKADQIDSMALTPDQFKKETDGKDFNRLAKKYRYPGMSVYTYMGFNMARKPFDDKGVRWALSHAIDRKAIIDGVLLGMGAPCTGPYSPLVPAYNHDVRAVELDLELSKRMLDDSGWKVGSDGIREKAGKKLKFDLITNSGNTKREKIVVMLQAQFKKIGVDANVKMYEWSTFLSNYIDPMNFDVMVLGWSLSLDPDLYSLFHSSQNGKGQFNFVSYKNAEVDELLVKGRSMVDENMRLPIYQKIHELIAADQPYAFLFAPDSLGALHKRFRGLLINDKGYSWEWPERWYVPKSVQRVQ